jgi:hypothetical protein
MRAAGNELFSARVLWAHKKNKKIFCWAIEAEVYNEKEDCVKREVVTARPDTVSAILYSPGETPLDSEVVMVQEFHATVRNDRGRVLILPGNAAFHGKNWKTTITEECLVSLGLELGENRLAKQPQFRQISSTVLSTMTGIYVVELTKKEMASLKELEGTSVIVKDTTKNSAPQVLVQVKKVREILEDPDIDWTTLGMLFKTFSNY